MIRKTETGNGEKERVEVYAKTEDKIWAEI